MSSLDQAEPSPPPESRSSRDSSQAQGVGTERQAPRARRLSGKAFAKLLGVSAAALSQSVKNEHYCGGYPCYWWADASPSGRVAGYDVPIEVIEALENGGPKINPFSLDTAGQFEVEEEDGWTTIRAARAPARQDAPPARENPAAASSEESAGTPAEQESAEVLQALVAGELSTDEAEAALQRILAAENASEGSPQASDSEAGSEGQAGAEETSVQENNAREDDAPAGEWAGYQGTSLLPPGEDYSKTVAAGGTAVVLREAIEQDNGVARALTLGGSAGIGALFGSEVAREENRGAGGFFGALVGAGLSAVGMGLLNGPEAEEEQSARAPTGQAAGETTLLSGGESTSAQPRPSAPQPAAETPREPEPNDPAQTMRHRPTRSGPRAKSVQSEPGIL